MEKEQIKKDFPIFQNNPGLVYLDSAATSLKPKVVIDKMNEYYEKYTSNVHRGVYKLSYLATEEYEKTRIVVAKFINASPDEIVYTKGATSALNLVALSLGDTLKEGDVVVSTELEHHSSILPWMSACGKKGATLKYIPLDETGRITLNNAKQVIDEKVKYLVITQMSNVLGYLTPLKEIIAYAHMFGVVVIVDAAQSAPHLKIDVKDLDCDFLAFSAHKMLGPTGFGILYGKKKHLKKMKPAEFGGDMIDEVFLDHAIPKDAPYKFEAGTQSIAEAIAFKEAINYLNKIGMDNIEKEEKALRSYAIKQMENLQGVHIYNKDAEGPVIAFNIYDIHPHDAATIFDEENVCLRAGHHCAQLVIKWLGVVGTLRASFYFYNTYDDVDKFIQALKHALDYFKEW